MVNPANGNSNPAELNTFGRVTHPANLRKADFPNLHPKEGKVYTICRVLLKSAGFTTLRQGLLTTAGFTLLRQGLLTSAGFTLLRQGLLTPAGFTLLRQGLLTTAGFNTLIGKP